MKPIIALMTDFGSADTFVGVMKGVILSIEPECQLIDLTHELPPGDIKRGAIFLWQSQDYFPPGTIFLCVVDPGVGTTRNAVIVQTQRHFYIGPDNGLFSFVCGKNYQARRISNPSIWQPNLSSTNLSSTFHGRDIFAPAAGYLAKGMPLTNFGELIDSIELIPPPLLEHKDPYELRGEILFADHFGNLFTSLGIFYRLEDDRYRVEPIMGSEVLNMVFTNLDLAKSSMILPSGQSLKPVNTFADLLPGECGFLIGSSGFIEIVSFQVSAKELLELQEGSEVRLILENNAWKNL